MRRGKLFIVGIGPGDKQHMTFRAVDAIEKSETIVGYKTYIELLEGLVEGKEIISTAMTQEIDRVLRAIECARQRKVVSLVSSGDAGVYGMAGLALDLIKEDDEIDVEIVPGVTAASSCAAILGAPIMHDAVMISLSDRLTDKDLILKRLRLAAEGDFVITLYNPRSRTRVDLFDEACDILINTSNDDTPVGLVWHAYRKDQKSEIIALRNLKQNAKRVDMFTTIIIGNSTTKVKNGRMVTARGYERKVAKTGY